MNYVVLRIIARSTVKSLYTTSKTEVPTTSEPGGLLSS